MLGHLTPSLAPPSPPQQTRRSPPPASRAGGWGSGSWTDGTGAIILGPAAWDGCASNYPHYRQGREAQRGQVTPKTYRQHIANLDPKFTSHQCQSHGLSSWLPPGGAGTSSSVLGGHQAPAQGHRSLSFI